MSQQHYFEEDLQKQSEEYEAASPRQNNPTYAYQTPQKMGISFDHRFVAALLSKVTLVIVGGLNLVIARQSIPLLYSAAIQGMPFLYGPDPSRYETLLLLLLAFVPLVIAVVLALVLFWLNLLVDRSFKTTVTQDGKLVVSEPLSIGQRVVLEFFSGLLLVFAVLDIYVYLHYGALYGFRGLGILLAFCSILTAVILNVITFLVSWLFHRKGKRHVR